VANVATLRKQKRSTDFLLSPSRPPTKKTIQKKYLIPFIFSFLVLLFLGESKWHLEKITKNKDLFNHC
jgi:hypothetical protein